MFVVIYSGLNLTEAKGVWIPESSQWVNQIWRHVIGYKAIYDLVK